MAQYLKKRLFYKLKILMKYIDNKENISSIYVTYKTVFFVVY